MVISRFKHKFYMADSKHGLSMFAARNITNREIITVFKGPLLTSYKQTQTPEHRDHYFQIGINRYQGKMPSRRRPVNHSCNPNSGIIGSMTLIAIRNIKKDEEICFDYSTTMYNDPTRMRCSCEEKDCRHVIKEFKYLPEKIKQKYIKLGIVPKWLLKAIKST
jgi:hypothetical protein